MRLLKSFCPSLELADEFQRSLAEVQVAHLLQSDKNHSQGGAKIPALHLVLPRLGVPGQCLFADEPAVATGRLCNSRSPSGPVGPGAILLPPCSSPCRAEWKHSLNTLHLSNCFQG